MKTKSACGHMIFPLCGCTTDQKPATVDQKSVAADERPVMDPETRDALVARLEELEELRRKIQVRRQRENFSLFFKAAWAATNPGTVLEWGPHIQAVCDHVQWQLEDRAKAIDEPLYKMRAQNVVINVPPRSLKPVHEDGLVVEKRRGLVSLKSIEIGDLILTHKGRFRRVEQVAVQGELSLLEIVTGRGRKIRTALDHPFLTQRGWVEAQHLTTKDVLAETHALEFSGTARLSETEARLIGYLIGDGGLTQKAVRFTNQDAETLTDFELCAQAQGFTTGRRATRSKATDVFLKGGHGPITGIPRSARKDVVGPVRQWLRAHDLEGKTSYTKRVPRAVMAGDVTTIAEYLAAYWACDGDIHDRRDLPRSRKSLERGTVQTVRISATTVSEGLARDHQALLQQLGLRFRVRRKENRKLQSKRQGGTYVSWDIVASDQDTAAKFMQIIGTRIRHEKRGRAQGLQRCDFDRVLYADDIVSISPSAPGPCRCLQVEEDSSFVYEGVAVHNTKILTFATIWAWLRWPTMRIMYLSTNPRVAIGSAREARDLINHPWFQQTHQPPWQIRHDQNAFSDLGNTFGGARISRGLDSTITGEGCVTGDTLVATECGEIPIVELEAMDPKPRVWSRNDQGELELRRITHWQLTGYKKTVEVRTLAGNVLRLTDDHKVWTSDGYVSAADTSGASVSTMPSATALSNVRQGGVGVSGVPESVHQGHGGVGEGPETLPWSPADLLAEMQLRAEQGAWEGEYSASDRQGVPALHQGVQAELYTDLTAILLEEVQRCARASDATDTPIQSVRALPDHVRATYDSYCVLFAQVQELGTQHPNARLWQLELQRQAQGLFLWALGQPGSTDTHARRASVHGVRQHRAQETDPGAPYRPRPDEQHAGESDRALFGVPYDAPQVVARPDTVLSVDSPAENGCDSAVPVYDISVEGNHNFFANGVLVHNCDWQIIDDPHDLRDSIEIIEKCIEGYDSAVANRINNPRTAIRTCIMQRVNILDFTAHVLKKGWMHIRIPMEYESKPFCTCKTCVAGVNAYGWKDWRTIEGEVLHPRFTPEFLEGERQRLGPFGYASQMQQRPAVEGGGRIKKDWWGFCRMSGQHAGDHPRPPGTNQTEEPRTIERIKSGSNRGKWDLDWVVISVDAANKKTDRGSAYGLLTVAGKDMRRFVLDDRTRRGEFTEILEILREMIVFWRPDKLIVEAKAAGPSLMSSLDQEMVEGKLRACAEHPEVHLKDVVQDPKTKEWSGTCKRCETAAYAHYVVEHATASVIAKKEGRAAPAFEPPEAPRVQGTAVVTAIEPVEVDIDKERRVDAVLPQLAARFVYVLEGAPWAAEFIEEHALFPESPWNDRVDALSQVLEAYKDGPFYVL